MIGVDEDEAARDAGARRARAGSNIGRPPSRSRSARVIEAGADGEARRRRARRRRAARPARRARRAALRAGDGDRGEDVLEREHVGEEARAAARVVAVEVEGHVRERSGRATASPSDAPARRSPRRTTRRRARGARAAPGSRGRRGAASSRRSVVPTAASEAVAVAEARADEVAVLAEAADRRRRSRSGSSRAARR